MSEATATEVQPAINVSTTPETPTVEAPKPESEGNKPEEKKTPEFMSDKFAVISRKEKAIFKAKQEIAAEKAAVAKEREEIKQIRAENERQRQLRENAKLDPDAYLNEAGLSYGSLTELNLKGGIDPKAILEKANQTIANFKKEQEDQRKQAEDQQKTQAQKDYEGRVVQFVEGIHEFVEQNKETYEYTAEAEQQNVIWDVIRVAGQRGQELTVKQATDRVEEFLEKRVDEKIANTKKFKAKYQLITKPTEPVQPGTPTLTNSMTGTTTPVSGRIISEKERIQNAMNVLSKFD